MRPAEKSYQLPEPLPDGLRAIGVEESGRAWLAVLPRLVAEVVERWELRVGEPFLDASASLTLRAAGRDERPVVLKLQYPHREAEQEAAALGAWGGGGAVLLLAHDPDRHALLLERCRPGTPLYETRPGRSPRCGDRVAAAALAAGRGAIHLARRGSGPLERDASASVGACRAAVRTRAPRRSARCGRRARIRSGRAGAPPSGSAHRQRPARRTGAVAGDRSEARSMASASSDSHRSCVAQSSGTAANMFCIGSIG
jgi:hypothetical protein